MAIVINGSGTVTGISVGGLPDAIVDDGTLATDSVTAAKLEASAITVGDLPAGSVLQVLQSVKSDTTSTAGISFTDTGLTVDITPSSTSSKILVSFSTVIGGSTSSGHTNQVRLVRDSTGIFVGDAASSRTQSGLQYSHTVAQVAGFSGTYLDSPSTTSATTYKLQFLAENGNTCYINRSGGDADNYYHGRFASSITVMEIAG